MNDQFAHLSASPEVDPLSAGQPRLSGEALARRRLLLRGASGGAAALAALKPVGALATGTSTVLVCTGNGGKSSPCTLSGVQSAAHSFGPNITTVQACGRKLSYWSVRTGSNPGTPTNAWPTACSTTCAPGKAVSSLLAGCNRSYASTKMLDLLNGSGSSSIEADFIVAYLNAASLYTSGTPSTAYPFPYSKEQVKAFWDAGDAAPNYTRSRARTLFNAIATRTT